MHVPAPRRARTLCTALNTVAPRQGVTRPKMWGGHAWRACGVQAYNGVWEELPEGSSGRAPGQAVTGKKPEKVGWTCPPQSTPWRRPWIAQVTDGSLAFIDERLEYKI